MAEKKRLFIGGLYEGVKDDDLRQRFSKFGEIGSIEVKAKTSQNGGQVKTFAYLDMLVTDDNLKKCMSVYNKCKWKGSELKLQLAKENFMDRLKKERLEKDILNEPETKKTNKKKTKGLIVVHHDPVKDIPDIEAWHMKGAKPGTEIPGEKNWIVGKYGRVLPILNVKGKDKRKMLKIDPAQRCHQIKRLPEPNSSVSSSISKLTWELEETDTEITKKRKGVFPEFKKKKKKVMTEQSKVENGARENDADDSFEVVPVPDFTHRKDRSLLNEQNGQPASNDSNTSKTKHIIAHPKTTNNLSARKPKLMAFKGTKAMGSVTNKPTTDTKETNEDSNSSTNSEELMAAVKWASQQFNLSINKNKGDVTANVQKSKMTESKSAGTLNPSTKSKVSSPLISSAPNKGKTQSKKQDPDAPKQKVLIYNSDSDGESISEINPLQKLVSLTKPSKSLPQFASLHNDVSEFSSGFENTVKPKHYSHNTYGSDDDDIERMIHKAKTSYQQTTKNESIETDDEFEVVPLDGPTHKQMKNEIDEKVLPHAPEVRKSICNDDKIDKAENSDSVEVIETSDNESGNDSYNDIQPYIKKTDCTVSSEVKGNSANDVVSVSDSDNDSDENAKDSNGSDDEIEEIDYESDNSTSDSSNSDDGLPAVKGDSTISAQDSEVVEISDSQSEGSSDGSDVEELNVKDSRSDSSSDVEELSVKDSGSGSSSDVEELSVKDSGSDSSSDGSNVENLSVKDVSLLPEHKTGESVTDENTNNKVNTGADVKDKTPKEKKKKDASKTFQSKTEKHQTDNQKRLEALKLRQKETKDQQTTIQKALASVDSSTRQNKRIVFESDDDTTDEKDEKSESHATNSADVGKRLHNKKTNLFGDDSDSNSDDSSEHEEERDQERFRLKPQFEGKAGQKLMSLQTKIGDDSRFRLDERFAESDDKVEGNDEIPFEQNITGEDSDDFQEDQSDNDLEAEKKKAIEILKSVVGEKKVERKTQKKSSMFKDVSSLRYDPSKEEHSQLEIKDDDLETKQKTSKKKKSKEKQNKDEQEQEPLPEVSGEKFYEVSTSFKDLFGNKDEESSQGFTFLGNSQHDSEEVEMVDMEIDRVGNLQKIKDKQDTLPWQHTFDFQDSSDEEAERENDNSSQREQVITEAISSCSTSFFFSEDDPRLKDGTSYFCRHEDIETLRADWMTKRPSLIEDYRMKRKKALRRAKLTARMKAKKKTTF